MPQHLHRQARELEELGRLLARDARLVLAGLREEELEVLRSLRVELAQIQETQVRITSLHFFDNETFEFYCYII